MTDRLVEWLIAGQGDGDGGEIGRARHAHERWGVPPKMWLEPVWGRLYYRPFPTPGTDEHFGPPGGIGVDMLGEFARLDQDKDGGSILDFARRYGVLGLCEHDLPRGHNERVAWGGRCRSTRRSDHARFPGEPGEDYWEPLDVWREWAARAGAILSVAANLAGGRPGVPADWDAITEAGRYWYSENRPNSLRDEGEALAEQVDGWLGVSGAMLGARWEPGRGGLTATTRAEGLLGAIGLQLLLTISGADGFATCAECGSLFAPTRRPVPGRRTFCTECGQLAARRQASRDYRRRQRGEP